MLKKSTLEHVLNHDLSELWSVLRNDEKRLITDNFVIHNFKKNQIIYAETEEPEYLWCLAYRYCAYTVRYNTSVTVPFLQMNYMCQAPPPLKPQ